MILGYNVGLAMMDDRCDQAYRAHLEELGHQGLTSAVMAGFDAWYGGILPDDRRARILDFGCGLGDFLEYLAGRGYGEVTGADINRATVTVAAARSGRPVAVLDDLEEYVRANAGVYDLINLKDVLEHIPDDEVTAFLEKLKSMLRDGGKLVVSCPQMCGFTSLFTLYNDFTHRRLYTVRSLRYVLAAAGLTDIVPVRPREPWRLKPTALALRIVRAIWFMVVRGLYMVERPGEEMPVYLGDRIMMMARKGD